MKYIYLYLLILLTLINPAHAAALNKEVAERLSTAIGNDSYEQVRAVLMDEPEAPIILASEISNGDDNNNCERLLLNAIVMNRDPNIIRLLIEHKASLENLAPDQSLIAIAVETGEANVVRLLNQADAPLDPLPNLLRLREKIQTMSESTRLHALKYFMKKGRGHQAYSDAKNARDSLHQHIETIVDEPRRLNWSKWRLLDNFADRECEELTARHPFLVYLQQEGSYQACLQDEIMCVLAERMLTNIEARLAVFGSPEQRQNELDAGIRFMENKAFPQVVLILIYDYQALRMAKIP